MRTTKNNASRVCPHLRPPTPVRARLDANRDLMQKAALHVKKALALDVPADAGTGAEVNPVLRPLRTLGSSKEIRIITASMLSSLGPMSKVLIPPTIKKPNCV